MDVASVYWVYIQLIKYSQNAKMTESGAVKSVCIHLLNQCIQKSLSFYFSLASHSSEHIVCRFSHGSLLIYGGNQSIYCDAQPQMLI